MEYEWAWLAKSAIPTMAQVLIYLYGVRTNHDTNIRDVHTREAQTSELDSTSSIRWTCMSIIVVRRVLQTFDEVGTAANCVIKGLAKMSEVTEGSEDEIHENAAKTTRILDEYLKRSWDSAASLRRELIRDVDTDGEEDRVRNIMQEKKSEIITLDDTWNLCGWAKETDEAIVKLAQTLTDATSGVLNCFQGAVLPWGQDSRFESGKGTQSTPSSFMPQFIPPRLLIQRLWLGVSALRSVSSKGWRVSALKWKNLADLSAPELKIQEVCDLMAETSPLETQLWRLQDLRSGGLVYSLELFIQAIKSSGKAVSRESSRELYGDTFRVLTRKWDDEDKYKHGVWTERLLIVILRHMLPTSDDPSSDQIPTYIIDLFLT